MPSPRMLPDTVKLYNYVGENGDAAVYLTATIKNCRCIVQRKTSVSTKGSSPSDGVNLYIFQHGSTVTDTDGNSLTYVPYQDWDRLADKSKCWTLHSGNACKDYFTVNGEPAKIAITGFVRRFVGSPRMWHFEVSGE